MARDHRARGGGDGRVDPVGIDGGAKWHIAPRQALGDGHDVGYHAIDLKGTPRAAAADATHDLVGNHQHPGTVANLADALGVAGRRRYRATGGADHGLENKRGDVLGAQSLDLVLKFLGAVFADVFGRDAVGRAIDIGRR